MSLLHLENVSVHIESNDGLVPVIQDVNFVLNRGEKVGLVGESGCGKSITALAIMSLLPPYARVSGQIHLGRQDLLSLSERQLCKIRGNRIGMVFQEPMTALNPVQTIGSQIRESLTLHRQLSNVEAKQKVEDLMGQVGLPPQRFPLSLYPHQLSGGQRQRVMIAMAIACEPDILIADEPTTALDVTVQEQILTLISDLAEKAGLALIMISHDLGVIAQTTERVMVMYAGRIVELGYTKDVFENMGHPYTVGLFSAIPKIGQSAVEGKKRLYTIPGQVPEPGSFPKGCSFAPRCPNATDICRENVPGVSLVEEDHQVWCYHPVHVSKRLS